jgi:LPXTG-site transpeptidase (sortase) family protein
MNHNIKRHFPWQIMLIAIIGLLILAGLWMFPQPTTAAPLPQGPNTDTPTATSTATATATPTPTATATATSTATPTKVLKYFPLIIKGPTGTVPTPTATGPITPKPTVVVSANPNEATVNQKIVFTVKITNPGLAPARNAVLSDSFPTTLDVTANSKTSQGTLNRLDHSLTVSLGDIMPNALITVTIEVSVNNNAKTTESLGNTVYVNYDTSQTTSGSVSYRVIGSGLPGTGQEPLESQPIVVDWSLLFLCGALGLAGIFTIWYGFWIREEQPQASGRYWAVGGLLAAGSVMAGMFGSGWFNLSRETRPQIAVYAPTSVHENFAGYALAPIYPTEDATRYQLIYPTEASQLPDYPIPAPTAIPDSQEGILVDTSPVVRLGIPAINLDAVVKYVPFDGQSWMISGLKQEIAWLGNTSWPGLGGNTALAGHVTLTGMGNGPFRYLDQLHTGDTVQIYTEDYLYTYKVREQTVVDEGELWVTEPTDNPQITLITCTDWNDEFKHYVKRLIVFADLKDTMPLKNSSLENR